MNRPMSQLFNRFPCKKRAKRKRANEVHHQTMQLSYGEQDQVDLISYSGLEENPGYIQMEDKYIRTLFISGYPYIAHTGWLTMLINFNHNVDISYHIEQIDAHIA